MVVRLSGYLTATALVLGANGASPQPTPSTPTGLAATAGDWRVSLTWSPAGGNPTSYTLKRSTTSGGPYTSVYSGSATSFNDPTTPNFRRYYYVVSATNASGSSPDSAEVNAEPTSACGTVGTACGSAAGSGCMAPSTCQGAVMAASGVPFMVPVGQTSGSIPLVPPFGSTTNIRIEIGTINISGIQPVAAETDTVIYLYREPGNQLVATNDDWQTNEVRSYASYIDTMTPLYASVGFSVSVRCKASRANPFCRGLVGFRIVDQTRTTCPVVAVAAQGTVCRPASGPCDVAETCDGRTTECPPDAIFDDHTVCRSGSGPCDIEERCTGASKTCPADRAMPSGAVCRTSVGGCDPAETCNGTDKGCPANVFASAGTVCRAALCPCDTDKRCEGASGVCPPDTDFAAGCGSCPAELKKPPPKKP
jgi:hypothetical protein